MAQNISRHVNGSDNQHPLLPSPPVTATAQGVDTYPRVISQVNRGDGTQLVTFALPGLRRAKMVVPESAWLALDHLAAHPAIVAQLERLLPRLQSGSIQDDT